MRLTVVLAILAGLCHFAAGASQSAEQPYTSIGFVQFPAEVELGAVSAVAVDSQDRIYVLQRGDTPLLAFDKDGKYQRGWGQGLFKVPHGLRVDRAGNI